MMTYANVVTLINKRDQGFVAVLWSLGILIGLVIVIATVAVLIDLFTLHEEHLAVILLKYVLLAVVAAVALFGIVKFVKWSWYF